MTILPVVARELSVQARRKSTYWIRVLASVVASFLMLWLMVVTAGSFSSINQGKELFSVLSMLAFVYCLSVGAIVTADCLSGEKRDGTIGLLFLTPLKGYDVVFGKLVSSSIHAVFGLLAIVPLVCKDRPSGKWKERWTERLRSWTLGDRSRRASFRTRLLDLNPCVWLSFRHRYKSALPWVLITPLTIIGTWIYFEYSVAFYESALLLVFTVQVLFKVWLTGETCNRWIEDRQSNALELLLCTPLRTKQIVRGQGMALLRQFGWPVAGVMGLTVLAWVGIARTSGLGSLAQGGRTWLVISIPVLIADLIALRWVGLWNGLTARSLNRAVIFTLGRVLFLRWPIYLAITGVASAGAWIGFGTFGLMGHPGVWLVLALSFDGAFALQARRRFFRHFRALAADPSGYNSIHSKAGGGATSGKATRDSAFKLEGTESRPKTTRWSRRRKAAIVAGLLLIVCFSGFAVRRHLYERKLEIRIQELRRAGFPTTRDELERLRPRVADAENTALLLERAFPAFVPPQRLSQTVQRNLPGHMADLRKLQAEVLHVEQADRLPGILKCIRYFVIEYHGVYPAFAAQFPGGSRQFFEQLRYQLLFQIVERTGTRARDLIAGLDQLEAFDQVVRAPYPQRFEVAKRMDAEVSVKSGFGSRGGILTPQFLYQTLILPDASLTARCRAAITVLAIERYRLRSGGSLPLRLEELVPEFLETIPIDPFDGSPIRFKRIEHGYCVYSVGSDGVDNGGAEVKERRSLRLPKANYDITFTIER